MEGATEVKTSGFARAIVERLYAPTSPFTPDASQTHTVCGPRTHQVEEGADEVVEGVAVVGEQGAAGETERSVVELGVRRASRGPGRIEVGGLDRLHPARVAAGRSEHDPGELVPRERALVGHVPRAG